MPTHTEIAARRETERIPKDYWGKIRRQQERGNFVSLGLDTDLRLLPSEYKALGVEEGQFQYNKEVIDSTNDIVAAYKPNLAFFLGSEESSRALERTVEYIHQNYPTVPVIGDVKAGDIGSTSEKWAEIVFDRFKCDAATVTGYVGREALRPFIDHKDKGVYVVCKTSNPGSGEFQDVKVEVDELTDDFDEKMELMKISGGTKVPFYIAVANRVSNHWNKINDNCGIVVGATYPEQAQQIRAVDPKIQFLVPGIGAQGGDLKKAVQASMDMNNSGIVVNASRSLLFATRERKPGSRELESVGEAARRETLNLRTDINFFRENPEGFTPNQKALADIFLDLGVIEFGEYSINYHETHPEAPLSPYYVNQRDLRSEPKEITDLAVSVLEELTQGLTFDTYADTPTAITPLVVLLSRKTGIPMITPRGGRTHGSRRPIDGKYEPGKTTAIGFDDVLTSGASALDAINKLIYGGVRIKDFITFVNREQGGVEAIKQAGVTPHSAFDISDLFHYYKRTGKISESVYKQSMRYLRTANR